MTNATAGSPPPEHPGAALDLIRGVWSEADAGGLPDHIVARAMMIEAVDRLAGLHGPEVTASLLDRLGTEVLRSADRGTGPLQ